jgi:serine/threonine protein kinase
MPVWKVGRYVLHDPIASGGMATVHLGRMLGPAGFSRTVAIKRLHPHHARDPEFVSMFLDEARLAARIQHPNVVATLDVVASHGELFLVMDFVLGESLSQLLRGVRSVDGEAPLKMVSAVMGGVLSGLHAAHEARTERGDAMDIVHRDVSPQNILVGADGVSRVVDFGVAKAVSRLQSTQDGQVKGKLSYMAPEQLLRRKVDRRADLYAAGVVMWEMVTGRKLFLTDDPGATIAAVLEGDVPRPSRLRAEVPSAMDAVILRAVATDPGDRYATALEFVEALESASAPAPPREVAEWVKRVAGAKLKERSDLVAFMEQTPSDEASSAVTREIDALVRGPTTPADARKLADAETMSLQYSSGSSVSLTSPAPAAVPVPLALAPPPTEPTRGLARRTVMFVAAALVVAGWGGAYAWMHRRAPVPAVAPETSSTVASLADTSPVGVDAASPSGSALATALQPSPSSSGSVATSPGPTRHGAASRAGLTSRPAPVPPSSAAVNAPNDCNPSFTLDANGIKRFKPQCL